ncbi:methylglyoxal reductase (NADPH-dependent) gre2 [Scheffersomyces spartinae]|uniref:Methylglyoxal reductase (NADPH-dependent) gre2 n=1 Tax=Scheffersomyces spartinae TaxID=45513 RepID=A0A9P8AGU5_9ASCO|nr:methylglyoxal reductase (NADPH-dependent) gre2 [Scheffersomyces spartinae]KAG7192130.1 methylglyoxal reductase (NADPH-dependent) gre2 [Scheffersomyces spartinae]
MTTTVFVSGATGFIAQHIIKLLLEKGYHVVGTVRSTEKGDSLKASLNSDNFSYEIVPDIGVEGAFDEALKKHPEVTVFLHTASPFHFKTTDPEKDLLLPAINGTKNALSSIKKYGPQITNVVVTSSYAAISTAEMENDPSHTNNEDSWNTVSWEQAISNPVHGYRGSKTFAEKAARDFVEQEKPNYVLATINPSFVFGPQAFSSQVGDVLNTSSEIINNLLKLGPDGTIPPTVGGFVDVRDVALAHLVAFEKPEAKNSRLLLNSQRFNSQSILDVLNKSFPQIRGKIPVGIPGSAPEALAKMCKIENERTRALIGQPLIELEQSVVDSVQQILDTKPDLFA